MAVIQKSEKLVIFIGEGKSEKAFIENFLIYHYGFKQTTEKGDFVLGKGNIKIYLAHPKMGVCHKGGDCTIYGEKTYRDIRAQMISLSSWIFKNIHCYEYLILTDKKQRVEKIRGANLNIKKHLIEFFQKPLLIFASYEIETWFISGIGAQVKDNIKIDEGILNDFLVKNKDVDAVKDTKEILDQILPEEYSGKTESIGRFFGENIDKDLAKYNSKSFAIFIAELEKII